MANGYNYLPEMQGVSNIQQRKLSEGYGQQRQQLARQAARSGAQSGGGYLETMMGLSSREAQGLSDIEVENMYKNAMLSRDERLTGEQRKWQEKMGEVEYQRQLDMMKRQQDYAAQQALWSGIGQIGGTLLSGGLSASGMFADPITKALSAKVQADPDTWLKHIYGIKP